VAREMRIVDFDQSNICDARVPNFVYELAMEFGLVSLLRLASREGQGSLSLVLVCNVPAHQTSIAHKFTRPLIVLLNYFT
jgi:hypothetical protein